MNKVFKVVWSATKHAYVVTSELAKSHQKSATTIVAAVILAASFSGGVAVVAVVVADFALVDQLDVDIGYDPKHFAQVLPIFGYQ